MCDYEERVYVFGDGRVECGREFELISNKSDVLIRAQQLR